MWPTNKCIGFLRISYIWSYFCTIVVTHKFYDECSLYVIIEYSHKIFKFYYLQPVVCNLVINSFASKVSEEEWAELQPSQSARAAAIVKLIKVTAPNNNK